MNINIYVVSHCVMIKKTISILPKHTLINCQKQIYTKFVYFVLFYLKTKITYPILIIHNLKRAIHDLESTCYGKGACLNLLFGNTCNTIK